MGDSGSGTYFHIRILKARALLGGMLLLGLSLLVGCDQAAPGLSGNVIPTLTPVFSPSAVSAVPSSTPTPSAYIASEPVSGVGSRPPPNPMIGPAWDKFKEALKATQEADYFHIEINKESHSESSLPLVPTLENSYLRLWPIREDYSLTFSGDYQAPGRSRTKTVVVTGSSSKEANSIIVDGFNYSREDEASQWEISRGSTRNSFRYFDQLSHYDRLGGLDIVGEEILADGTPVLHLRGTRTSVEDIYVTAESYTQTDIWISLEDGRMAEVRMENESTRDYASVTPCIPPSMVFEREAIEMSGMEIVGEETLSDGTPVLHLSGKSTSNNGRDAISTDIWIGLDDGLVLEIRTENESTNDRESMLPCSQSPVDRGTIEKFGTVLTKSITSVRFSRYNEPVVIEPPVAPPTPSPTPTATPTAKDLLDLQSSLPEEDVARRILEAAMASTSAVESFQTSTHKDIQIGDKPGFPEAEVQTYYLYKFLSYQRQQTTTSIYRRIPKSETLLENDTIRIDGAAYEKDPFTGKWDVTQASAAGRNASRRLLNSPVKLESMIALEIVGEELLRDGTPVIHVRGHVPKSLIGIRCDEGHATLDVWIETDSAIIREEKAFGEQLIDVDLDDSDPFGNYTCPGPSQGVTMKTITSIYTTTFSDDVEAISIEAPIP